MEADLFESLICNSFKHFSAYVMGNKIGSMHEEWISALDSPLDIGLMAARGHFKTTTMSVSYPLWRMYKETDPRIILGVSATQSQSAKNLDIIKHKILTVPILKRRLLPERLHATKWSDRIIKTRNGHIMYSHPFNDSVRGIHADLCISDDVLKAEITTNVEEAKNVFYGTIFPTTKSRRGKHIVIGTPTSYKDLLHDLSSKQTFKVLKYPAVIMDGQGKWIRPIFPEHFTLQQLSEIKATMPPHLWAREYMCEPVSSETSVFSSEILQASIRNHEAERVFYDMPEAQPMKFLGCDIAVSETEKSDWSVFSVLEKLDNRPYFLREVIRKKLSPAANVEEIERLHKVNCFTKILIERTGTGFATAKDVCESDITKSVSESFDTKAQTKPKILSNLEMAMTYNLNTQSDKYEDALVIPDIPVLLSELGAMTYGRTRSGVEGYYSAAKHDDCVMSLALALECAGNFNAVSVSSC